MGIFYIFVAIAAWALGDFFIQRSARKVGDWEALFFITFLGAIVLLPFVYSTLASYTPFEWLILVVTGVVIFFAAILDFDALRVGKIAVIEPILALEVPITVALATFVLHEDLSSIQLALIGLLLVGIYLVSNKTFQGIRIRTFERGVAAAVIATIGMGTANFLYGVGSRETTPLMINWFTSAFMAVGTLAYLIGVGEMHRLYRNLGKNFTLITAMSISDNLAWIAFSASVLYLPIGIATGLSESYVALAALLGLVFNREKLRTHQLLGLCVAILSAVVLGLSIKA